MLPKPIVRCNGVVLAQAGAEPFSTFALSTTLVFDVQNIADYASVKWTLIRKPTGSTAALTSATTNPTQITGGESVPGTLEIRCVGTAAGGEFKTTLAAVVLLTPNRSIRILDETDIDDRRTLKALQDTQIAADAVSSSDATALRGRTIATTAPTNGQTYVWNSTSGQWEPGTGGATTFSGLTGRWSLSQVDNSSNAGKFLRDDGSWQTVSVAQDFTTVALASSLTAGYGSNGNAAIAVDTGKFYAKAGGSWTSLVSLDLLSASQAVGISAGGFLALLDPSQSGGLASIASVSGALLLSGDTVRLNNTNYHDFGGVALDALGNFVAVPYAATPLLGSPLKYLTSDGAAFAWHALSSGDIPDLSGTYLTVSSASLTYATKAALTGTGYFKGAGSFPPSFSATIPVSDLSGVSSWAPTFTGLTLSGATASTYAKFDGSKALASQSGVPVGDLTTASTGLLKGNGSAVTVATLVDADVSSSAAIAGTKISPDFGSQVVTTTGQIKQRTTAGSTKNESDSYVVNAESTTNAVFTLDSFTPIASCIVDYVITVVGIKSDETVHLKQDIESCWRVSSGGTCTEMGSNTTTPLKSNGTTTGFVLAIDQSGGVIRLRVTPPTAGGTIEWTGNVSRIQRSITQ